MRRVEAGEEFTITVAGRASARLVAATPRRWRPWNEIDDVFHGPTDHAWDDDMDQLDHAGQEPWERE